MFEKVFKAFTDIYEYSKYDKKLVESNDDFLKLLRVNIPDMSDTQFEAIYDLIDFKIKEKADGLANVENLN